MIAALIYGYIHAKLFVRPFNAPPYSFVLVLYTIAHIKTFIIITCIHMNIDFQFHVPFIILGKVGYVNNKTTNVFPIYHACIICLFLYTYRTIFLHICFFLSCNYTRFVVVLLCYSVAVCFLNRTYCWGILLYFSVILPLNIHNILGSAQPPSPHAYTQTVANKHNDDNNILSSPNLRNT